MAKQAEPSTIKQTNLSKQNHQPCPVLYFMATSDEDKGLRFYTNDDLDL